MSGNEKIIENLQKIYENMKVMHPLLDIQGPGNKQGAPAIKHLETYFKAYEEAIILNMCKTCRKIKKM